MWPEHIGGIIVTGKKKSATEIQVQAVMSPLRLVKTVSLNILRTVKSQLLNFTNLKIMIRNYMLSGNHSSE